MIGCKFSVDHCIGYVTGFFLKLPALLKNYTAIIHIINFLPVTVMLNLMGTQFAPPV